MVWYPLLDLPLSMGEKAGYERQRRLLLTDGQGHPWASVDQTVCSQILEAIESRVREHSWKDTVGCID